MGNNKFNIQLQDYTGEGHGDPLQYSCLENPVDRGTWWSAVHRVAQSRTRLKRLSMHTCIGEGNGNPLQYFCLENPRDRGAWWAAVYGVAQSPTWLKWLSSSSTRLYRVKVTLIIPECYYTVFFGKYLRTFSFWNTNFPLYCSFFFWSGQELKMRNSLESRMNSSCYIYFPTHKKKVG